ncbi:NUDIX domain-containing protein [Paraburkholderia silviterrae]|uniref:NUDIX domain-containing protein n=1 Tax=Paraburkholderia silviterrae TaxID=2528715 RepID=A0A4R5M5T0_9BURK|nr:NUDIX domain-containing protein [Paraburkholderia silviterrae]TDG21315.1 NUDIX domain-containing protein [Paraburkholderia silviterrae]
MTYTKSTSGKRARKEREFSQPYTTVDVVIFTVIDNALQVLLVQRRAGAGEPFPGRWALPGGFVDVAVDATLEDCARRKLFEKTGVKSPYLEQLGSWGSATRDPRAWSATHVWFALIPAQDVTLAKGANAAEVAWFAVDSVIQKDGLAFDHDTILQAAVERLRSKVEYTSLPAFLLTEPFTLPQLQRMYEVVLGRPVDKSGFRTRMLAASFLKEAGYVAGESNRPAVGYRLADRQTPAVFPRTFSPRSGQ